MDTHTQKKKSVNPPHAIPIAASKPLGISQALNIHTELVILVQYYFRRQLNTRELPLTIGTRTHWETMVKQQKLPCEKLTLYTHHCRRCYFASPLERGQWLSHLIVRQRLTQILHCTKRESGSALQSTQAR